MSAPARTAAGAAGSEDGAAASEDGAAAGTGAAVLATAEPAALGALVDVALRALREGTLDRGGPLPAGGPGAPAAALADVLGPGPLHDGVGAAAALGELGRTLVAGAADPGDPRCAGHLHCPPLAVSVAADLLVGALNPSLDSWDQGPSGLAAEDRLVAELLALFGWAGREPAAAGLMTTGGSGSNLTALHLAREAAGGRPVRVLASRLAHVSLVRSCRALGLGADAVATAEVDEHGRLRPEAAAAAIAAAPEAAWVLAATAGTTDHGAVDPLDALADVADAHGAWLHVDAAFGGPARASARLAPLLHGIERARSVALDLHKLGWQPAACGALLLRDGRDAAPLAERAAYLSEADDEAAGYPATLGRSLRTTRRPDAFRMLVTLRALGWRGLGALADRCHDLARHAAARIAADPRLELEAEPTLTTVLFRHRGDGKTDRDALNGALRRRLIEEGRAVVGRTALEGPAGERVRLKLTLLHPHAGTADVAALVDLVADTGDALLRERAGRRLAAAPADPLRHPDPRIAGEHGALEALLRCWVRETGAELPPAGEDAALTLGSLVVVAPVLHRSACGWHRFGPPRAEDGEPLGLAALAGAAAEAVAAPAGRAALVERVRHSAARIGAHVADRRAAPDRVPAPAGSDGSAPAAEPARGAVPGFLEAERALLLGHPFHPAAKSRPGATEAELRALSPELRGTLRLRWWACAEAELAGGSATGTPPAAHLRELAAAEGVAAPDGCVPLPLHPVQARLLRERPGVAERLADGRLRDLGEGGAAWSPTSSLRTLHRDGVRWQLKVSLGLRITNSVRENLPGELELAVRAAPLFDDLRPRVHAAHPAFDVLDDPVWADVAIGADELTAGGPAHPAASPAGATGLAVALRDGAVAADEPLVCLAGLVAERPEVPDAASRLVALLRAGGDAAATREGTRAWVRAWLDVLVIPVVALHDEHGVGLELHHQNALLRLDAGGVPVAGRYRDGQGWWVRRSHAARLAAARPGLLDGVAAVHDDDLVLRRMAAYVGVNQVLGLVGHLGAAGCAPEEELLALVGEALDPLAAVHLDGLAHLLLHGETLPAKANLMTAADGRDELVAPVAEQSVEVAVPNPLRAVRRAEIASPA